MRLVRYLRILQKPYCLTLDGKGYGFKDTKEIVPFVQSMGWTVKGI